MRDISELQLNAAGGRNDSTHCAAAGYQADYGQQQ
jgi:hypothetical protein